MKYLFFLLAITGFASEATRNDYLALIQQHPALITPTGNASLGEIEILLDPVQMAAIEKKMGRDVGVIKRDKYWLWINDACRFPSGQEGIYARIVWAKAVDGPVTGVAVMPVLPDGKVVLNLNFRHATRCWEIELPRGGINAKEAPEDAAKRETLEETGMEVDKLIALGTMPPDSGLTSTLVPVFAATVVSKHHSEHDETEAIADVFALSIAEIKEAFRKGFYLHNGIAVPFRDPFLAYAVLQYELRAK